MFLKIRLGCETRSGHSMWRVVVFLKKNSPPCAMFPTKISHAMLKAVFGVNHGFWEQMPASEMGAMTVFI